MGYEAKYLAVAKNLSQLIGLPTCVHVRTFGRASILDLTLTLDPSLYSNITIPPHDFLSAHRTTESLNPPSNPSDTILSLPETHSGAAIQPTGTVSAIF